MSQYVASVESSSLTHRSDRVAQSMGHLTRLDTRSGHILLFHLPLIQEGQLSVTGEKYARSTG